MMAHFRRPPESFSPSRTLGIVGSEFVDDHTVYNIQVSVGLFKWCVRHRYSDFYALHEKLMRQFPRLEWGLLPKKKLFGSQSEQFILKRQSELEAYLRLLLQSLPSISSDLMKFLDFHKYEVHGITELLTETLYELGDSILASDKLYHMSPLQLYAICTRLALPEPTCESKDVRKDIGHLLDFVTRLKCLQINGSALPVGRSNINMNELAFDLHCFKSLTSLHISGCSIEKISDIEHLKKTLVEISVSNSLSALKEFLLIGIGRGQLTMCDANTATLLVQPWSNVRRAFFNHNRISHIDESVKLLRNVELLDLSHNRLDTIDNLQHLSCLRTVVLAHNVIQQVSLLHTKLGNVTQLDISNNRLESLDGLAKLYSLEVLDVSHNNITQILDVKFIGGLPCLELLILSNNPVTSVLDYRMAVFEIFAERAREICLDGIKPTEQEIELVAVRSALNKSREQKRTAQKTSRKVQVNEPTIADAADSPELSASPAASNSNPDRIASNPDRIASAEIPSHETLPVVHPPADFPGESASASEAVMLHQKIVHLKETGGSCWLRQLNDLLLSEGHSPLDPAIKTSCDVPSELPLSNSVNRRAGPTSFPLGHLKRMQRKVHESESASRDDGEPNRKTKKPANIMLPETLPSAADGAVCAYLQSLLPSRSHKAGDASEQFQELPIHVMWCTAMMHHTKQAVEFPACVFITTENVHVFSVRSLAGDTGIPELSRTMRLPLEKVTQIAVGYDSLYIQLEWAATEPRTHGLVVFLTFSHGKSNAFINAVKLARRRSVPELDEYEDPHIVPGSGLEASLKQALMSYERCLDLDGIHVLLYLLVMVEGCSPDTVRTSSLVVTSRYIYLVSQDYCNTPLSSFAKASPSSPAYEVVSIFPVSSRLVNIQMYDIDTIESSSCHSLWSTFGKTGSARGSSVGFIGYGVRMSFHLGEYGIQVLDVRMPTSNQREKFLSTLIKVHASVSDVLTRSSLQRIKTPSPMRDADSLSCGSCESQRSSGQPKGKKSKKRPTETLNPFQTAEEHTICTTHEKNQISDNTTPDLRSSSNLDRGDSKILNSVVTIAEVTSPSAFRLSNGKFESSVISEKDPIRPGPDAAPMLSPTFEPHVGGDNPALSSTDNQPLPVVLGDIQFSEKDFNGHDSSTCDKNSVHDDVIEQNESTSKTILYDSEILQDPVGFGKSHGRPLENASLCSASSSDEESSYEDAVKQGHCEDGRVATENTPADTQFVSDSDIAVVRLSVGEVGSTNRRSSVNSASKNSSFRRPPAVNDMVLHLGKEKGQYIAGKSETAPLASHFGYPSNELLLHLAEHFEAAVALFLPVSPQFEAFMSLSSLELVNYFHQNIAVISVENEELSHVMWSFVVPYVNPSAEIPSCVLLSTKAIYFASDRCEHKHTPVSALKSHKRCFSDTLPLPPGSNGEFDERSAKSSPCHLSCGILNNSASSEQKRVFRVYGTIMLKDLKQVNIGIFSQWIRLTGPGEESVYSCVTRDCRASETFLHRLKGILTRFYPLPSPEANVQDLEQDFYSMFSKSKPKSKFSDDGRFVYPLDDSISDTTFLIRRSLKGDKASTTGIRLLSYLLCFQVDSGLSCDVPPDLLHGKPRTVILTEEHLVLAVEDHVSYPLPDFTRTPPARPQMEIAEVRRLDFLQQIALRPDDAHLLVLVFSDETGELVVDTSVEHFGADGEQAPQKPAQRLQEIRWTLLVQNVNAKDKLIRLISQQWEEQHGGRQLSISTLS